MPAFTGTVMKFYIETDRLILREILPTDVLGMFELDSNETVHQYLGKKPIKTKLQAANVIKFIREQYKVRGIGRFAVVEKSSGGFIGWSGLKLNVDEKEELNGKRNFYDIGYRFIPRFWGNGYATESSLAILDFGFKELEIETIYGAAEIDNIASNIVLQKIGLQFVNEFHFEDGRANWYELKKENYGKTMS
jgi:ribosomal-protein-alanine N-acetyltransferase